MDSDSAASSGSDLFTDLNTPSGSVYRDEPKMAPHSAVPNALGDPFAPGWSDADEQDNDESSVVEEKVVDMHKNAPIRVSPCEAAVLLPPSGLAPPAPAAPADASHSTPPSTDALLRTLTACLGHVVCVLVILLMWLLFLQLTFILSGALFRVGVVASRWCVPVSFVTRHTPRGLMSGLSQGLQWLLVWTARGIVAWLAWHLRDDLWFATGRALPPCYALVVGDVCVAKWAGLMCGACKISEERWSTLLVIAAYVLPLLLFAWAIAWWCGSFV